MRLDIMFRPKRTIHKPRHRIILVQMLRMGREEFYRLGPEGRDGFGTVVEVDVEAVGFVVVGHVVEDVVVDVAEELDFGFDAPVVLGGREGGVVVEEAAVPATHAVVADFVGVLDVVLFEDLRALFV
jgi:hypothetical protein